MKHELQRERERERERERGGINSEHTSQINMLLRKLLSVGSPEGRGRSCLRI